VQREAILDAAQLCKHFGKAQGLHRVKVNYLEVKYVSRSPAKKDGEVHLLKAPTTITVSKDDARVERLIGMKKDPHE
jgi:predicted ribosome quality control (RQC) complex YloA/Tae2 family protein